MVLRDPGRIDFDGEHYPMPKQGAAWDGFSVRFNDGAGSIETLTDPLSQVRDAPYDDDGLVLATMRTYDDDEGRTHFFMTAGDTWALPSRQLLFWDVVVTDPNNDEQRPIGGRMIIVPAVTRAA